MLSMTQIDIQACNVELTQKNALHNALLTRVIHGDFLKSFEGEKFDMIVTNPPFYHQNVTKSDKEHIAISRYSDYLPLEAMIKHANSLLRPHGKFYCCYDAKQLPILIQTLTHYKLNIERLQCVHSKKEKEASLVLVEAKKSSKSLCRILPPLVVHDEEGYTLDAQKFFSNAATTSLECPLS